ncbi:MAG: alpha/beta hydrolase-fold protein [Myxococcota bacterium]
MSGEDLAAIHDARLRDLATGALDDASVRRFADEHGVPLVSADRVTFVYYGRADAVHLRHWVYGLPGHQPFSRLAGTNLWFREVNLPPKSRVEYKLEVVVDGEGQWHLDPLNPRRAHDPFGANSVCHGPGYVRPAWTLPQPDARSGALVEVAVKSRVFGETRRVPLYLPARFRTTGRYPLLVVHDGSDYVDYAALEVVLDNLIDGLEIPPLIAALSNPGERLVEYPGDPRHAQHITEELVPYLEAKFPVIRRPNARGIAGASFGAVASLYTAWRYPGFYGRLLLQSGSFAFTDIGPHHRSREFDPVVAFMNAFRRAPGRPSERVFVSCGTYESLIYENRSMVPFFQGAGLDVRYVEARDGHNWENWRDRLREGLSWLFPGPLWMTYE